MPPGARRCSSPGPSRMGNGSGALMRVQRCHRNASARPSGGTVNRSNGRRQTVGKVFAGATMSLDGFIAGPEETGFDLLFKWYQGGDVEVPMPDSTAGVPPSHVAPATAELLRHDFASWGALVVGRHLF